MSRRIKKRLNINPLLLKVILSILVITSFLLVVWQRTQVLRLGYQLERMKATKNELLKENKGLLIEVSSLTSLERIERIATEHLRLRAPDRKNIYIVKKVGEKSTIPLLAKGPQNSD
jgi:cell division protein FtsL